MNITTENDKHPLSTAKDLFANLAHKKKKPTVFSIMDLSGAFNQFKTAPSVFHQVTMDKILAGIENVMCFVDDILVTGSTEQEHLKTLEQLLQMLDRHNVRLKKTKCQFLKSQVQYLGYTVNANRTQSI